MSFRPSPPGVDDNPDGDLGSVPEELRTMLQLFEKELLLNTVPTILTTELISRSGDPRDPNDGVPGGEELTADKVFRRIVGPRIRPTNPFLDDPDTEGSEEDALNLAFGAAPIDPMNPDHQDHYAGGGGMPVSPTDVGVAGSRNTRASFSAPVSALNQMEDEWP